MRKWVTVLAWPLVFAAGFALGVAITRHWAAERPPRPGQPAADGSQDMAKKAPLAEPSVADDEAALVGTWIHEEENRLFRVRMGEYGLGAFILSAKSTSLDFALEDRDGRRVLVEEYTDTDGDHKNPLYEYRLRGDRLELSLLPGAAAKFAESADRSILDDLGGTWFRA